MTKISSFGFGTAYLHHLSKLKQKEILNVAVDSGITHFDTAPYYGYGIAESALSSISNKKNVTIASKFGLYPKGGSNQNKYEVVSRKLMGKLIPSINKEIIDFSIASASRSLDETRRRIKRDYLDYFMLHEPSNFSGSEKPLEDWLNEQVKIGNILNYGLAGSLKDISLDSKNFYNILQSDFEFNSINKDYFFKKFNTKTFFTYHWLKNLSLKEIRKKIIYIRSLNGKEPNYNQCFLFSTKNIKHVKDYTI